MKNILKRFADEEFGNAVIDRFCLLHKPVEWSTYPANYSPTWNLHKQVPCLLKFCDGFADELHRVRAGQQHRDWARHCQPEAFVCRRLSAFLKCLGIVMLVLFRFTNISNDAQLCNLGAEFRRSALRRL